MRNVTYILRCGALLALAAACAPAGAQDTPPSGDVGVVPVEPAPAEPAATEPAPADSQPADSAAQPSDSGTPPPDAGTSSASGTAPADSGAGNAESGTSAPAAEAAAPAAADATAAAPAATADATAATTQGPAELPDVVVTSQKLSQTLEQTPASVSSISGDFLHDIAATNFRDLANYAGNVSISLNHTAGTFAIRGFATPDTNPAFDPSVGAVIDGVYYGRSQFFAAFFHDIDRFEVLRGPQGTLFGKNCTAGLMNLVTEAPTDQFTSTTELILDGKGERSMQPALSSPLGAGWAVRLAGNFTQNDRGYLYNTKLNRYEQDQHEGTLRMRLRYLGDGPLTGDLEAFRSSDHYNNNGFQFTRVTADMLNLIRKYDPRANVDITKPENSASLPAGADATIDGVNGTVNYELAPDVTLTSISAYAMSRTERLDLDADFSPVPFIHDKLVTPKMYRQYTEEMRVGGKLDSLLGFGHGFNFVSGVYLARTEFHTSDIFEVEDLGAAADYCSATQGFCGQGAPSGTNTISGHGGTLDPALIAAAQAANENVQNARVRLNQQSPSRAVFGQFEHFFLEDWAVIGGLRWGVESKVGDAHAAHTGNLIPSLANEKDHNTFVSRREHDFSPKGGLKWQPDPDDSVYATWSRGYKSGGFNGLPLNPTNLEYEPEVATSKEIGAKTKRELFGGPVRLSVAAFKTDFDNLQVSTFTGGSFVVLNAAAARSQGAEMDFHWLPPVPGVSIVSSLGYADAYYKSYPCAPAVADNTTPSPAQCAPAPQPGQQPDTSSQDLTGKPLALASRWTGNFTPGFQFPLTSQLGGNFAVDLIYRSKRYLDVDDDVRKLQPDTTQVNARMTLASYAGAWLVTVGAHNITDRVMFDQIINQPLAPGNFTGFRTDRGRYYSMSVTATF